MLILKRVLYLLVLLIYMIGMIPAFLIGLLAGKHRCRQMAKKSMAVLDRLLIKSKHTALAPLEKKPYVYIANHQCYIDAWTMSVIEQPVLLVVFDFVKYFPVIGSILKICDSCFKTLGKEFEKENVTAEIITKLKKDPKLSLFIFSEGGRQLDLNFNKKLRTGAFHVAKALGYEIVPIYETYGKIFNDKEMTYDFSQYGKTRVITGKPISPLGKTIDELKDEYIAQMEHLELKSI
jgi:1-acyl-sn-glycerol-3-phosphate acyltransferase